jgi:hypothetical protein
MSDQGSGLEIVWSGDLAFVVAGPECFELGHRTKPTASNEEGVSSLCEDCGHVFAEAIRAGHPDPTAVVQAFRVRPGKEPAS